jgi:hypothetical protein
MSLGVSFFVSQSKECVVDSGKGGVLVLLLIRFASFVNAFVYLDLFLWFNKGLVVNSFFWPLVLENGKWYNTALDVDIDVIVLVVPSL